MAAYFYTGSSKDIFSVRKILPNVKLGFLESVMPDNTNKGNGVVIVSEVSFQNRDTIQYFLTFDDLITYFYFGKGLGSMTVTGSIIANYNAAEANWDILNRFMKLLGGLRGKTLGNTTTNKSNYLMLGDINLEGVLSTFTVRASADVNSQNCIDFTLQIDIIKNGFESPAIPVVCNPTITDYNPSPDLQALA